MPPWSGACWPSCAVGPASAAGRRTLAFGKTPLTGTRCLLGQGAEAGARVLPRPLDQAIELLGERPHKLLIAAVALGDLAEALLPQRRHIRRGGRRRQRLNQRPPGRGRLDALALTHQKAALEQQVDNACSGRFCAEAIGVAQGLADLGILHIAGDAGHGRQQGGIGERLGRLGHFLLQFAPLAQQLLSLFQGRQRARLLFVVILLHPEQRLPARLENAPRLGLNRPPAMRSSTLLSLYSNGG